jgi:transposase
MGTPATSPSDPDKARQAESSSWAQPPLRLGVETPGRRKRRLLTPEEKWQIFLEVTSQQLTQADAARKWGVDTPVVIKLPRDAKDAALAAFAAAKPGRVRDPRDREIELLHAELAG